MTSRSSRASRIRDYLLHLFSGNAGLAFFGLRVRPEDADEQEARRREERERLAGRDETPKPESNPGDRTDASRGRDGRRGRNVRLAARMREDPVGQAANASAGIGSSGPGVSPVVSAWAVRASAAACAS